LKSPLSPRSTAALPIPDADALAHSQRCAANIRAAIKAHGGWISFATFMELALYAPGLGYYAAGARKFGPAGDFVTAPEISMLFGQCVARSIASTLRETGGDVLELGPGSGKLACDVLEELERLEALPRHYHLLEVSADLRERQTQALARLPSRLANRATWLDALPAQFTGAIIANEVLDVVPVQLLHFTDGNVLERGVSLDAADGFIWRDEPLTDALNDVAERLRTTHPFQDGTLTEVAPAVDGLVASLAGCLSRGTMLLIDYGFRAAEFYHPSRHAGTLMCHYRHYAHTDPFLYPGLQDITAHVDFTRVADVGMAAGLELAGYTSQAQFLMGAGLADLLRAHDPRETAAYLAITNQVQRLTSPAEMGEFFKVIAFTRGVIKTLAGRPLPL
jgi:SAM-dependent MidA family methyltransferase